jgi:hypothetical protein
VLAGKTAGSQCEWYIHTSVGAFADTFFSNNGTYNSFNSQLCHLARPGCFIPECISLRAINGERRLAAGVGRRAAEAADGFEASQPRGAKECDAIKLVAWDRVNEEEKNKELACSLATTNIAKEECI